MANNTYKLPRHGIKVEELLNKIDVLSKGDIGLDQVDNTSDKDKPVSILQRQALNDVLESAKAYTDNEIAEFDFIKIVTSLPETGLPNRIYLVPKIDAQEKDLFDEYLWVNNKWEWISTKTIEVDLADVYTKEEITILLNDKVDKIDGYGLSQNDFTDEDKNNLDENTAARHEHENKGVLDGITAEDVNKWNSYQEYDDSEIREAIDANSVAQHTHENKGILDGITQEDIASIHSHNNMDFLEKCEYIYFNSSSSLDFVKEGLFLVKFNEIDWETSITEAKNSGKFTKFDGMTEGIPQYKQIFLVMYVDKTVSESKTTNGIVNPDVITKKYGHQIFFGDGTIYKRKITEITEQTNTDIFNPVYETTYEFEPLEEITSGSITTEYVDTAIQTAILDSWEAEV